MIYQWKIQLSNKQIIQVIFSQRKDAIIHRFMFLDGSEVAVKSEYKTLSTILDSELNFQSYIRQAVIKARRGTVLEPFPIYPITYHGVFWTKYIKFMCDHTCIMMTSFITNMTQSQT